MCEVVDCVWALWVETPHRVFKTNSAVYHAVSILAVGAAVVRERQELILKVDFI